jgi:serine/threonine protein kinase
MCNFDSDRFIGKIISGFEIIEKIGSGAIGVVFLAEDRENYLKRAIKIIPKKNIDYRPNWEQEIKKSNILQPIDGVVQYISHGKYSLENEEFIYIVWQYINSESLKSVIENGKITIQILIDVIERALDIFDKCRENNIQHSDFHSGNILVALPSTSGLDKNTRKIWVTDFGYGTFSNEKQPLDDYKGLARIIRDAVEKIKRHTLERDDRIKYNALKNEFPKYLYEENAVESDFARNPGILWEKLQELFRVREKGSDYQKSVGDYLAAEFIGDRLDEWDSLFVPKFLGAEQILDRNICVLTGLRGCGKTMMFRRLSTQLVSKLGPTKIPGEESFICFYLNARNIAEAFPWLPETEENIARNQVINFFHLKWTIEILQWLKFECKKSVVRNRDIGWLINFFINYFYEPVLYLTSNSPFGIIDNIIHRCNEEMSKAKLQENYNASINWPLSSIDYLEKIMELISTNTLFTQNKVFYMLFDDYSTPLVTETTQRILNPVIFRRCSSIFFKVSTESTESLLRIGLNGKPLQEDADFKFVELGILTIRYDAQEKKDIISEIFNKRIIRSKVFAGKSLDLRKIIGGSDINEVDRALKIRENDRHIVYYGFDVFCNMWSSDLRELIKIFSEMISEEGENNIEINIFQKISPIISRDIQNTVFRLAGGRCLNALSIATNPFKQRSASIGKSIDHEYGKKLYEIVTAFQEIAYFALKTKNSKNQKSNPPKQARKIELTTAIDKLDEEGLELYRGLIRYGVFIKDHRGKSVRGTASVRLYLRSLLIPYCRLTFSKRDNISFEWEELNDFLRNPEEFKKDYIKKVSSQLKKEEDQKQQKDLLFSYEERIYVTTDNLD